MSRPDSLPPTARAIALILSSTPAVQDAQPGVLLQLLEFAHRYTGQILTDATVYSEHAGRNGKIELDDVTIAVQARVGWEFGGRVPKEYMLSLANQINAVPLPAVPEVFGVRIPGSSFHTSTSSSANVATSTAGSTNPNAASNTSGNHTTADILTAIDFDLLPNEPPPGEVLFDEYEEEEIDQDSDEVEDDDEDDDDMEAAPIPITHRTADEDDDDHQSQPMDDTPFPISAIATEADMQSSTPAAANATNQDNDEGDEELFSGDDEDGEGKEDEQMDVQADDTTTSAAPASAQRNLVEQDDYD